MSFGHLFWLGGLSTQGQRVWTAFRKIFSGTPHLTIFVVSKYAPQIPYLAVFGHVIGVFGRIWAHNWGWWWQLHNANHSLPSPVWFFFEKGLKQFAIFKLKVVMVKTLSLKVLWFCQIYVVWKLTLSWMFTLIAYDNDLDMSAALDPAKHPTVCMFPALIRKASKKSWIWWWWITIKDHFCFYVFSKSTPLRLYPQW